MQTVCTWISCVLFFSDFRIQIIQNNFCVTGWCWIIGSFQLLTKPLLDFVLHIIHRSIDINHCKKLCKEFCLNSHSTDPPVDRFKTHIVIYQLFNCLKGYSKFRSPPPHFLCRKLCESLNSLQHFPISRISCRVVIFILHAISCCCCCCCCCYIRRFMTPALSLVLTVHVPKYIPSLRCPYIFRWLQIL